MNYPLYLVARSPTWIIKISKKSEQKTEQEVKKAA